MASQQDRSEVRKDREQKKRLFCKHFYVILIFFNHITYLWQAERLPKNIHMLILGPCDQAALHSKGNFADAIKRGDYPGSCGGKGTIGQAPVYYKKKNYQRRKKTERGCQNQEALIKRSRGKSSCRKDTENQGVIWDKNRTGTCEESTFSVWSQTNSAEGREV